MDSKLKRARIALAVWSLISIVAIGACVADGCKIDVCLVTGFILYILGGTAGFIVYLCDVPRYMRASRVRARPIIGFVLFGPILLMFLSTEKMQQSLEE